ncbi:MAG: ABC transporter substrate-binding protein [Xanthobacteraceae bacterium]
MKRALLAATVLAMCLSSARAEVTEVKFARQFGLPYLALVLMEKHQLIEKHAAKAKVNLKANWATISAASINESMISGAIHISATGTGPMVLVWDRTKGNLNVKGLAAISDIPMSLMSRNPNFKTLKDISASDRIALPAANLGSMQAITLKKAATQLFGNDGLKKFDTNMISMAHPDALAALLSGKHEVNAHFTTPPYSYIEAEDKSVHRVLSSFEIWGPSTLITINTSAKFFNENPNAIKVILAALQEACDMANSNRKQALADYIELTKEKLSPGVQAAFLADKEIEFNIAPRGIYQVAEFMLLVGAIKNKANSWKDLFHSAIHDKSGS